MAFCPHCGKPAGDQAIKCVACGKTIEHQQVGARGGFKGTMMMRSPAAATPAGNPAQPSPPAASNPTPGGSPDAPDLPVPPPQAGARPAALKATMVGGMGAAAPAAASAQAKAPAAGAPKRNPATARTAPAHEAEAAAPTPGAATAQPDRPPQAARPAAAGGATPTGPRPQITAPQGIYPAAESGGSIKWVAAGVGGMLVIAGLGFLAAKLLGLL